jgi:phosphonate transport system substrate-binding protein
MRMLLAAAVLLAACNAPAPPPAPTPRAGGDALIAAAREPLLAAGLNELSFGVSPYVDPVLLRRRYEPLLARVSERLGVPVRLEVGRSYQDMEDRCVAGAVDVCALSPYSYVRAEARAPGLRVFATLVADGSPSYGAYVIALEDGPVQTLADLRGRRMGFVDRSSTSGFLFPAERLLAAGLHPLKDLDPRFLGGHDRVFEAVVAGEVDAGALYAAGLEDGRRRHPDGPRVRVVAKARRIPCDAYAARPGLPPEVAAAFGQALSEISTRDAEGRRALDPALKINGFLPVTDEHYDVVREVDAAVRAALD